MKTKLTLPGALLFGLWISGCYNLVVVPKSELQKCDEQRIELRQYGGKKLEVYRWEASDSTVTAQYQVLDGRMFHEPVTIPLEDISSIQYERLDGLMTLLVGVGCVAAVTALVMLIAFSGSGLGSFGL